MTHRASVLDRFTVATTAVLILLSTAVLEAVGSLAAGVFPDGLTITVHFVSTGRMEGVSEDEGLQLAEEFLQAWPNHPLRRQMTETVVLHLVRQERQGMATDLLDDYEMRWPGFKARSASLRSQLTTATRN